ncbi:uncharacterized protein LOC111605043 [Drosophila hydei]|uniref:Uncharacterized protein LOC111605043 n=1 Tax=Drosophila hydei TaxID=7224 RepID=A0A6J2SW76_DROHY|nr:uncharacterized protein LOC111605043 [Drosophila hydei]
MSLQAKFQCAVLFVILFPRQSRALRYIFDPEFDDFFDDCHNSASNVINIHELCDLSELTFMREDDKMSVVGNVTIKWNIQLGDRIEASFQLFRFDRINWQQTPFGMTVHNFCPILFDEPQYWYKYWTKYIINKEEVKEKCFYSGSKLIHEPFTISMIFDFTGLPLHGRYKIVTTVKAFNSENVEREISACFEVEGKFHKNPFKIEANNHTMLLQSKYLYVVYFISLLVRQSSALKYLFVPENDELYGDCQNQPNNVLNVHEMSDLSELSFTREDDKILVFGNCTFKWNIQHGDRIAASFQLFRFDRINWQQTPFGMTVHNFCPILFDEPQTWYKYWTKYVTNKEQVKNECLYPGTKFIHMPFAINMIIDLTGLPLNGRYKIVVTFKAFSPKNVERTTSVCIEIEGAFERLN